MASALDGILPSTGRFLPASSEVMASLSTGQEFIGLYSPGGDGMGSLH